MNSTRGLLIVLGILLAPALAMPLLMGGMGGMMGPGMMGPGMMSGRGWGWGLTMGLGGIAMLAFWGALIVGIVLVVRKVDGGATHSGGTTPESPIDILHRRYAAGDLAREQCEHMRQDLER